MPDEEKIAHMTKKRLALRRGWIEDVKRDSKKAEWDAEHARRRISALEIEIKQLEMNA